MLYRIKNIMAMKGVPIKDLAELMEVIPKYVSSVLREKDSMSVKTLCRIADILEVPVSSLFADYEPPSEGDDLRCPHCHRPIRLHLEKG